MLTDENNNPTKILGRLEWPIAVLYGTMLLLVLLALLRNV